MNKSSKTRQQLLDELQELTSRMMEAEETLRAIVGGEVDGLVVSTAEGERVFTLTGADHPYRVMVETMSEGAVTLASDGTILFCNRRFADIVKESLEKVIGSSIYQYISSTDLPLFKASLERGLKESSKVELALQTGGGTPAPVFISLSSLQRTDIPGAVCMVVTDLTEQKRNEDILAEERLTTQILNQAAEIFVLCDHQGRTIRASQSTKRLFSSSPIFQAFDEAFHLLYPDGTPFVLLSATSDKALHAVEVTFTHGDKESFSFLLRANSLITPKGVIGIVVVMVDITERKKMDNALKERAAKLELVNQELDSFSYSISHDLRAPLRAIDGYSRMILRKQGDKFDQDTQDLFNVIRSNSQMMGKLIDELLAFSRLGRKELSVSKLDLNSLIKDVWKELQVINPDRHISLKINEVRSCMGDRTLITQVYTNLLSNAIKFTKKRDHARIEVGEDPNGNENIYYVKDNGIGFEMEHYNRLFSVFQRLHSDDEYEGTGVGLAICQRIIHRHGGRVWAESKVDQGACFYFTLQKG